MYYYFRGVKMARCPHCEHINYGNFNDVMHDDSCRIQFFNNKNRKKCKCSRCLKFFYLIEYIYRKYGFYDYSFSLTEEVFNDLQKNFGQSDVINYLPNENLKQRYNDAQKIIEISEVSDEIKMGSMRPLIECFVNYENGEIENNKIRGAIKKLGDEELEKGLHKILDDALKGVHVKEEQLNNDPKYIMECLELLFIKKYLLPVEKQKIEDDFKQRTSEIDKIYEDKLKNIK